MRHEQYRNGNTFWKRNVYPPGGGFQFPGFLGFSVGNFILGCSLIHEMISFDEEMR